MSFVIKINSFVNIITNSSSELFVGKAKSKEILEKIISNIHPNWEDEYYPLKGINELTNDDLRDYIYFHYNRWSNSQQTDLNRVVSGFEFGEMYEKSEYSFREYDLRYPLVTDENRERFIDGIDPDRNMYFLFSIDDNPNFDYQEKLEEIMTRYHLG